MATNQAAVQPKKGKIRALSWTPSKYCVLDVHLVPQLTYKKCVYMCLLRSFANLCGPMEGQGING